MRVRYTYSDRPGLFEGTMAHDVALLCETCQEPITSTRPGMFQVPTGEIPKDVTVRAVHKGSCDDRQGASWADVDQMLGGLLRGLGYHVDVEKRTVQE